VQLLTFVAGSPLYAAWMIAAQREGTLYPPSYSDEVMGPMSLQEIEEAAKKRFTSWPMTSLPEDPKMRLPCGRTERR